MLQLLPWLLSNLLLRTDVHALLLCHGLLLLLLLLTVLLLLMLLPLLMLLLGLQGLLLHRRLTAVLRLLQHTQPVPLFLLLGACLPFQLLPQLLLLLCLLTPLLFGAAWPLLLLLLLQPPLPLVTYHAKINHTIILGSQCRLLRAAMLFAHKLLLLLLLCMLAARTCTLQLSCSRTLLPACSAQLDQLFMQLQVSLK